MDGDGRVHCKSPSVPGTDHATQKPVERHRGGRCDGHRAPSRGLRRRCQRQARRSSPRRLRVPEPPPAPLGRPEETGKERREGVEPEPGSVRLGGCGSCCPQKCWELPHLPANSGRRPRCGGIGPALQAAVHGVRGCPFWDGARPAGRGSQPHGTGPHGPPRRAVRPPAPPRQEVHSCRREQVHRRVRAGDRQARRVGMGVPGFHPPEAAGRGLGRGEASGRPSQPLGGRPSSRAVLRPEPGRPPGVPKSRSGRLQRSEPDQDPERRAVLLPGPWGQAVREADAGPWHAPGSCPRPGKNSPPLGPDPRGGAPEGGHRRERRPPRFPPRGPGRSQGVPRIRGHGAQGNSRGPPNPARQLPLRPRRGPGPAGRPGPGEAGCSGGGGRPQGPRTSTSSARSWELPPYSSSWAPSPSAPTGGGSSPEASSMGGLR